MQRFNDSTTHTIQLAAGADEKISVGHRNHRAQPVIALIAHWNRAKEFELFVRRDDKNFAAEVLEINFSVRARRRTLDFDARAEVADPIRLAGCGVNAG